MGVFSEIFSWWGGNTWGTRLTIARQGRYVGGDSFGASVGLPGSLGPGSSSGRGVSDMRYSPSPL